MNMTTSSNEPKGPILRQLKFEHYASGLIRCARLNSEARLPFQRNLSSYDLYACEDTLVTPDKVTVVNTG